LPVVGAGVIIEMSLSIPFPLGWLLNKNAARVEVNILLAFLHWVEMALHP